MGNYQQIVVSNQSSFEIVISTINTSLDGWLAGWLADWLTGWLAGWMDGWMDGQVGQSAENLET